VPYVLSFLANMLTCSCIEFSMGLIVNSNHQLWDYSNEFCNIMGQVCLQNALGFGVAASVITWFIYPLLERWIARMPEHVVNIAFVVIAIFGGILWSLYIVDPPESLTGEVQQEEVAVAENVASDEREAALVGVLATTVDLADVQDKVEKDPSLTPEQRQQATDKIHETIDRLNEVSSLLSAG
jgi:uncharacterized membrane protein